MKREEATQHCLMRFIGAWREKISRSEYSIRYLRKQDMATGERR
jgi:hypothetical protein